MSGSAFRVRGCHPLWPRFPACSAMHRFPYCRRSYNPGRCQRQPRFGLLRVRSPLLAQSLLLSLPPGTKMFQFPGFALRHGSRCRDRSRRVSPFGHPRVTGHLPLTAAFRSLSRPSSPPRATGIPRAPLFAFSVPFSARASPRPKPGRPDLCIHKTRSIFPILSVKSLDFLVLRSHHVNDLVLRSPRQT